MFFKERSAKVKDLEAIKPKMIKFSMVSGIF